VGSSRNNISPRIPWMTVRHAHNVSLVAARTAALPSHSQSQADIHQAHITDIFGLASTPTALLSVSGSSTINIQSTTSPTFPLTQSLENAHKLGAHHICTSRHGQGLVAASVGFGGEIKIWTCQEDGKWALYHTITPSANKAVAPEPGQTNEAQAGNAARGGSTAKVSGDAWAVALSADEQYLACTTADGRIHVWDVVEKKRIQTYETGGGGSAGSFALAVDLSRDGRFTASGHANGTVYVFNNDAGRLMYSLPGEKPCTGLDNSEQLLMILCMAAGLAKTIRAVAFSPGCKRLAAAGDAGIIALYDMEHGEHVSNLTTGAGLGQMGTAWVTSVDWNETGAYLLSGTLDGKARIWDVERGEAVASHSETDKALWAVRWLRRPIKGSLPAGMGKGEMFCAAGANRSISFYREATGI
jgi:superkiller protein 8